MRLARAPARTRSDRGERREVQRSDRAEEPTVMVPLRVVAGEAEAFHPLVKLRQHRGYPGCKPAFVGEVRIVSDTGLNVRGGRGVQDESQSAICLRGGG